MFRAVSLTAFALTLAAPSLTLAADTAPVTVNITSALAGERGFGRVMSSASTGDVEATARDVERELQKMRWLRIADRDAEVTITVDRRERTETSRSTNKKGELTINHRYTASASLQIGGNRDRLDADTTFSQGPSSTRDDTSQFNNVAKELAGKIAARIGQDLDSLRPNRPQAGFDHKAKYKMLIRGDGLEVTAIAPGSPAEEAGLAVGDRIRSIDGEKGTDQMGARVYAWWTDAPGARYTMEVERNKIKRIVQLSLAPPRQWAGRSSAPAREQREPARMGSGREPAAARTAPAAAPASEPSGVEITPGMTEFQVVKSLGTPQKKVAFGTKTIWTYDGFTVTFVGGKVTDVK